MRIIFMGTPALAVPFLEKLHAQHEIIGVVTQPDKPAGRGGHLTASPVKEYAAKHNLPIFQPNRARDESFIEEMIALAPDAIAVVAFGQILPRAILELPPNGCVNAHFSLLPRWRGAAPVQHALLSGDKVTGVTIQHMAEKLDAGDVVLQRELAIEEDDTTLDLWHKLTPIGADLLGEALSLLSTQNTPRTPQDESQITLAPTLKKEDGRIDWTRSADEIVNQVRGTNPWPGAWCEHKGKILKVWRARVAEKSGEAGKILDVTSDGVLVAAGEGAVLLREVQAEGRPRLAAHEWARGARLEDAGVLA